MSRPLPGLTAKSAAGGAHVSRRDLLKLALAAGVAPGAVLAQDFTSRPIRLMVGTPPGGSIDSAARVIAPPLAELLQASVIVENKPGAAGVLNSQFVAKSAPDGHTLLVGTPSVVVVAPQVMRDVTFNPLTELVPINMVSTSPIAIAVNPRVGVKTLKELVALSRTRPVTMGLPLAGSVSHIAVEMTAKATGCNFLNVPYKGAAPMLNDLVGGHVETAVSDAGVFIPMHRDGRVRILFVTSEKRIDVLPDVPTLSEDVPGLVITNWMGLFAPAGTPKAVVDKINAALARIVARDDVRAQFQKMSVTTSTMPSPEAFQKFVASEYERYGQIVRERRITIDG